MKRPIILLLTLLLSGWALADEQSDFDRTMQGVAADLSALHAELQAAYTSEAASAEFSVAYWGNVYAPKGQAYLEVTTPALLYKGADVNAGSFQMVAEGEKFKFVDKVSDWYAVALEQPMEGFSSGWVQAAQVVPVLEAGEFNVTSFEGQSDPPQGVSDALYKQIVDSVSTFREKYEENRHIAITGFSVDIGIPPGVSVQFAFK